MSLLAFLGALGMLFTARFTWHQAFRADQGEGGQSRRDSLLEAWTNICIGFSVNFAANLVLIPLMTSGAHVTAHDNFWGGWIYTAISILRQYAIRRWFNERFKALLKKSHG